MKKILAIHNINTSKENNNAFQLIVNGEEFIPFRLQVKAVTDSSFTFINKNELNRYYLGQEMLDLATTAAYHLNIPSFTVQVQRKGKELSVVSIEKNLVSSPYVNNRSSYTNPHKLIGADLEVMARKKENGSFVAIPADELSFQSIGADRALIRKGNRFFQPIIELRARPQSTGGELHQEFKRLKKGLEQRAAMYGMEIVAEENPKGRFLLGGHFHISNERPNYRKISLLDSLVALPLSCKIPSCNLIRRRSFGRLGAVRVNFFNGFEYRTLPTWYGYIDSGEPFFQWMETIFFNESIPTITIPRKAMVAYYAGNPLILQDEVKKICTFAYDFLSRDEKTYMKNWLRWLDIPWLID